MVVLWLWLGGLLVVLDLLLIELEVLLLGCNQLCSSSVVWESLFLFLKLLLWLLLLLEIEIHSWCMFELDLNFGLVR